jgi:hypothetical protein
MKKLVPHTAKSKRYKQKTWLQKHVVKHPKMGAWNTNRFIHGPRIKQPTQFKYIFIEDIEKAKRQHLALPKQQLKKIEIYADKHELTLPKSWKEKVKIKVGTLKKTGKLDVQSTLTPVV